MPSSGALLDEPLPALVEPLAVSAVEGSAVDGPLRRGLPKLRLRPLDALLPLALVMWVTSVEAVNPDAMNDYGLFPALPVTFFLALGLLVVSIVATLIAPDLSPARLSLHLVALVVVLHGTLPLVFSQPIYPWAYKHVGVVNYINLRGSLDSGVDIYHNWPGFFAWAAWLTRIAGVASPLVYAEWAPIYFNLLSCLVLAFAYRSLPVTHRVRWLGLFVFVAGNWVGQDYFAPQAIAFVLSLAVYGMTLAWLRADRPPAFVRAARRLATRASGGSNGTGQEGTPRGLPSPLRVPSLVALFVVFTVLVVTHQLSPYFVLLGLGLLTVTGMMRPRWVVVGLGVVTVAYLLLHYSYIERTQDLFSSFGDPLNNVHDASNDSEPMRGRRLTALAAPALVLGLWMLGLLGVVRRLRNGRPTLVIAILAAAPTLLVLGQSYGGEAVFRIYLFSLPWTALLAASALEFRPGPKRLWPALTIGAVLAGTVTLFMSAFYGSAELYQVRPGEVLASQYFYHHAEPDSVLTLVAANFPTRVGARYDEFRLTGESLPNLLTTVDEFRHRMLGADELPAIERFVGEFVPGGGRRYLALSVGQTVYSEVLGLLPKGSLASLDQALGRSPRWSVYHRNSDAVIYRFEPAAGDDPPGEPPPPPEDARGQDRSVDPAGLVLGVLGFALLGMALARRLFLSRSSTVVINEEEKMNASGVTNDRPAPAEAPGEDGEPQPLELAADPALAKILDAAAIMPTGVEERLRLVLSRRTPERDRFAELVGGLEPVIRPHAVRVLSDAWRPIPTNQLQSLLGEHSPAVRAATVEALDLSPEGVSLLHQLLASDLSAEVRMAVLGAFARAPEGDQLSALSRALADPHVAVRAYAVDALPVAGTAAAANLTLAACEDRAEEVRRAAYRRLTTGPWWVLWESLRRSFRREELLAVLHDHGSDAQLAAVALERMASPDPADRLLAVQIVGAVGTPESIGKTISALQDRDAAVRAAAAGGLKRCDEAVAALSATLKDDPDPTVRREAAIALAGCAADNALLAMVDALQDPEPSVRHVAIQAVLRQSSSGLARHVVSQLTTANMHSVGQALLGMGHVGEEALRAALDEGHGERAMAVAELLRSTDILERLRQELRAVDPVTRLRAVEAVGAVGGAEVLDELVAALSDSRPEIRARAAFHLGRAGGERSRQALRAARASDQVADVAQAAGEALRHIDHLATAGFGSNGDGSEASPQSSD